jgi:hypothetical protein
LCHLPEVSFGEIVMWLTVNLRLMIFLNGGDRMAEVPFYRRVRVANLTKKSLWEMLLPAVIHLDQLGLGLSRTVL